MQIREEISAQESTFNQLSSDKETLNSEVNGLAQQRTQLLRQESNLKQEIGVLVTNVDNLNSQKDQLNL